MIAEIALAILWLAAALAVLQLGVGSYALTARAPNSCALSARSRWCRGCSWRSLLRC